jgi:hypothetical protein
MHFLLKLACTESGFSHCSSNRLGERVILTYVFANVLGRSVITLGDVEAIMKLKYGPVGST